MSQDKPSVLVLAGPNGAGQLTLAPFILRSYLHINHFVNADTIATGLSAYQSDTVALQAGRIMLKRLNELADSREHFGFETTLATRSYATWLKKLQQSGYLVDLIFVWLPSVELAINRVKVRVSRGGHDIPENVIRRRYESGIRNLNHLFMDFLDHWMIIDGSNSETTGNVIAHGIARQEMTVRLPSQMKAIEEAWK